MSASAGRRASTGKLSFTMDSSLSGASPCTASCFWIVSFPFRALVSSESALRSMMSSTLTRFCGASWPSSGPGESPKDFLFSCVVSGWGSGANGPAVLDYAVSPMSLVSNRAVASAYLVVILLLMCPQQSWE